MTTRPDPTNEDSRQRAREEIRRALRRAGLIRRFLQNDGYLSAEEQATARRATVPPGQDDRASGFRLPRLNVVGGGPIANFLHNFRLNFRFRREVSASPPRTGERPAPSQLRSQSFMSPPNSPPTRYAWEQVEKLLTPYGITRQTLEESGFLADFLNGRKTGVLAFRRTFGGQPADLTGKLYLVNTPDRGLRVHFQTVKQTLVIPETYLGHRFTPQERRALHRAGEVGALLMLTDKITGKAFEGYVGVDAETQSLTVLRRERVRIPQTVKGVTLTDEQRRMLEAGKAVKLAGLAGRDGRPFNAYVQVSAAKRALTFARIPGPHLDARMAPAGESTTETSRRPRRPASGEGGPTPPRSAEQRPAGESKLPLGETRESKPQPTPKPRKGPRL